MPSPPSRRADGAPSPHAKPKLAIFGAASCGGCDIAIVNIHEHIVDVANAFDIVLWPTIMDGKYATSKRWPTARSRSRSSGSMRTDETVHPGQAPAPQVEVRGRVRLVRQRGLHPRPRQPLEPQADHRHGLLHVQHGQPRGHPPDLGVPGAGRRPPPARVRAGAADARPGRGRRLHDPRLPARVQADLGRSPGGRGRAQRHRAAPAEGLGPGRRRIDRLRRVRPQARRQEDQPSSSASSRSPASTRRSACWSRACPATARRPATAAARCARPPERRASAATERPMESSTTAPA
jgi:hypothetical protein